MHKKAFLLSFWWILLWAIFLAGLAIIVLQFESYVPDTRNEEAKILAKTILQCITENGNLKEIFSTVNNEFTFNLEDSCNLNLKIDDKYEYHIALTLYPYDNCNAGICTNPQEIDTKKLSLEYGSNILKTYCNQNAEGKVPLCFTHLSYLLYKGNPSFLEIKIAILKLKQNGK